MNFAFKYSDHYFTRNWYSNLLRRANFVKDTLKLVFKTCDIFYYTKIDFLLFKTTTFILLIIKRKRKSLFLCFYEQKFLFIKLQSYNVPSSFVFILVVIG